jgi:uncharacterized protein
LKTVNSNAPVDRASESPAQPVVVPHRELSPEALRGVVEAFVLREGTDYGAREFSLDEKVIHVLSQLDRGEAQVLFDPDSETVQIATIRPCRTR